MATYDVGFRTKVENNRPRRWFHIIAKASQDENQSIYVKNNATLTGAYMRLFQTIYWKLTVIVSIFINIFIFITYFWFEPYHPLIVVLIAMHSTCLVYWIDFIGAVIKMSKTKNLEQKKRRVIPLLLDAISLMPLSAIYLIIEKKVNMLLLWELRIITLIRFYRIPWFFSTLNTSSMYHWITLTFSYLCYFTVFIVSMSNIFVHCADGYYSIDIHEWNKTIANKVVTSLYYSIQIVFNVGYGDITPVSYSQLFLCLSGMCFGAALTMGILPGIIGSAFMNITTRREQYRHEFEGVKNTLKRRKIESAAVNTILDNMVAIWKYKEGYRGSPPIHILPTSIQREIFFDINFGLLSHSVIFSTQPRHFLRSVTIFMRNYTYLSGDIVLEPGLSNSMICIASGIVEVLSEENDDTPLFSLTHGSIIGEMSLFFPLARLCVLRASTYVELQVLKKVHLTRLALSYPEIFRSMRESVSNRFTLKSGESSTSSDEYRERKRRRDTKLLLETLKQTSETEGKKTIWSLYTLSENIPRVKNYPLTLIRGRPWILRPDTSLTKFWEIVVLLFVLFAITVYPTWASFRRKSRPIFVLIVITRAVYIIDVYMECTTAIENKDNYTFVVTIKEIIARKLKTVGFYLDILAAYELSVYAPIIWPEQTDYVQLLLLLNALLKTWRVYYFIKKQENNIRNNLFVVITIKYALWIILVLSWGASLLYLEARPGENYIPNRWFYAMEVQEVENHEPNPRSLIPETVTFYFASISMLLVGYGDIVPKSVPDCIVIIICILSGFILGLLWVVETSTAQKHLTKIRTSYQEEVFSIAKFMTEHDISETLQKQVKGYMQMQWNYDKGYSLKKFSTEELLVSVQRHIILNETIKNFFAVPVFRGTSDGFLKLLAKLCKIRILPPNELITEKGSVMRTMYILESGYCQVSGGDANTNGIIRGVNSFDYIEMLLGEEKQLRVETITHARVISITYGAYLMAITAHPSAKFEIEDALRQLTDKNRYQNILAFKPFQNEDSVSPLEKFGNETFINVHKYHKENTKKYSEPFQLWGKFRFFEYFFLPFVLKPDSLFLKIWMTLRIVSTLIIGFIAPIQFSILRHGHPFMHLIIALQIYTAIDMYLMFHIAYYNENGILVFHPAKTSLHYLKSHFVLDLISVIPYYWLQRWILPREIGNPFIKKALGMIIIIQMYKFFQACHYLEQDIRRKVEVIKALKLLPLLLMVIHVVTGFIILLQCYLVINLNVIGLVGSDRLAEELMHTTNSFCCQKKYGNLTMDMNVVYKMYLTTFYWVTTTITVCGFGDIVPQDEILMVMVIVMVILGIFFFTFMFANITSSMVNTNILVSAYRKRMLRMIRFMRNRKVNSDIQKRLIIHFEYNWMRKEGLNPQGVLYRLNAKLRENIIKSMYEGIIQQNPILSDYEKYIVAILCKNFDEIYFLQGETIAKYKNINNDIYLVYRGKVNVITPNGKLITSLGCGAMFGNISNKPFFLSPETVVAAENVDLLSIDRKTFFLSLQDLPGAEKLLQTLTSFNRNYIKEKVMEDTGNTLDKNVKISKYRIPSTILRRGGSIHLRGNPYAFRGPIVYVFGKIYKSFVILPDTPLSFGIDSFFSIMAFLSYFLTTYTFAFQDFQMNILIYTYLLDGIFLFKIYLQLHKTEADKYGESAIDISFIQKRYFKSQKIIYDLLSNAPLELLMFAGPRKWWFKLLSILRLNRVLRLYHLYAFFKREQHKLMTNRILIQISWTAITISLLIHTLACIFFFSVCPVGNFLPLTWITEMNLVNPKNWEFYVYSIYHVIVSTTTAGLQVNKIYSNQGILLSTTIMILCRYTIVLLTAFAVSAVNANSYHLYKFQAKFNELKATFKRQNLSEYIVDKMLHYLSTLWSLENGKQIPKFIVTAPYSMKCDVMFAMFGMHLSTSYIFSSTDIAFRRQLASHLRRFVYFSGNYIVQQGDIDHTMYFIETGEVSVLTIHPELLETIHYTLIRNDSFGVRQGLILGKAHQFSYRAETRAEVLHLTYKEWQHLLKYFPEDAKKINNRLEYMTN